MKEQHGANKARMIGYGIGLAVIVAVVVVRVIARL